VSVGLTDFDVSATVEEDVVTLDVSVDDVEVVEVLQALAGLCVVSICCRCCSSCKTYLEADCRDLVFGNGRIVVNDIGQSTSLHELHYHPELELLFL
jgi:hypothetical protein